jgi:hypothetical protein
MSISYNNYKCAGVLYRIDEIEYTKKSNWPKRSFYLEVPTMKSMSQGTEIYRFLLMGDDAKHFDYEKGEWLEVLFRIEGRFWKPPDEPDKEVYLGSLRPVDIHKGDNPFEGDYQINQDPDDLSPDYQAELAKNVKDYSAEVRPNTLFDNDGNLREPKDGLPF